MKSKGQTLIELLITIGLSAILIPALLAGFFLTRDSRAQQGQRVTAILYLKEAEEAVRIVRDNGWENLTDGTFHPVISGSTWSLSPGPETINGFTRQIVISDVYRATASGDIIQTTNGILDPSTKEILVSVSWNTPLSSSVSATAYLTRHTSLSFTQTTVSDFSPGTTTNTTIASTTGSSIPGDGQIQLGAGGAGDWCKPGTSVVGIYNLPGQGVVQDISATSSSSFDVAYTTTGGNASGDSVDELNISKATPSAITNPAYNNEAKAYGIYVDNQASYVYFNENNPPNHTVRIVNASTLSPVGYFDASGGGSGTSVYVSGNTGYTTVGNVLYSFDVTSNTGSRPQLGSVTLAGNGKRVVVFGNNAYVATDSTTSQLQIINVSNPSNMTVTKSINLGNGLAGVDVFVNNSQTYAYVVTAYATGKNDFFIVDLTNTNNIYGYSTNGMSPRGVIAVPGNRAIIVGSGGTLYQVFDITNPNAASYCGGMSPAGVSVISAVAPVVDQFGNAYSYIITDNANQEFQIVLGGPGGQFSTAGTYTSAPYMATNSATFNRFSADISQPSQAAIGMQVAVTNSVSGSCTSANYTFVGPDGTTGTYFTPLGSSISAQIPFTGAGSYTNPGQCFEYKTYFSTNDPTQSPIFYDITVSLSP